MAAQVEQSSGQVSPEAARNGGAEVGAKRYALVGAGSRSRMFLDAIAGEHRHEAELVALCDLSQTRMQWHNQRRGRRFGLPAVPTYHCDVFEQMIREQRPDTVIVTTTDGVHHLYVIAALRQGCDVICEKPLTTRPEHAQAILDAVQQTGRRVTVAHNARYAPAATTIKQLLMDEVIGTPLAVDLRWMLDTSHGADYFRRWHADREQSGGLLIHKSSHHFDRINWWLADQPESVVSFGDLKFYGCRNAEARGEHYAYDRYTGQTQAKGDPFALFLDHHSDDGDGSDALKGLYLDAEDETGYLRDRNVFGDHISIEDTVGLLARYRGGAILTYSLIAYSPWEGYQVAITGTKGRLELTVRQSASTPTGASTGAVSSTENHVVVYPMFKEPWQVPVPRRTGGHDGSDPQLLEQLFALDAPVDPYHRHADHVDGCAAILIGMAANESMRRGEIIRCDDLLPLDRR